MSNINNLSAREQAREALKDLAPKNHINGLLYTREDAKKIPREFECDKHGAFKTRFSDTPTAKIMVNAVCGKCIDEHDSLIDKKEAEIKEKLKEKEKERQAEYRLEQLQSIGVGKRYLQDNFDSYIADTKEKKNALDKCKQLCQSIKDGEPKGNLIMVGGVGTGKTHLANSVVVELYDHEKSAERINLIELIRALKSSWNKDADYTETDVIKAFTKLDLLIIDEVGIQFNSDTEKLFIFDIINGRYDNCLPTIIISNLDIQGVKGILGERCVDRLREDNGKVVAFNWESYRS